MIMIEGTNYMTVRELAHLHGVTVGTARNWRAEGREPVEGLKLGHSVLYREADVLKDIASNGRRARQ
ncbi:helix-turn-helix domain-containing protein [Angustibacter sp. Root456]|uniref:helix-turn-helix domain-containing protein n=1 Tax=Angustibacter sp. Root456 TaxID=1736539 RepID=UPI0006FB3232|nr:helix-turn-helix domain-containing protein [Angustibacter sp. Root456]KQX66452.1 hypothetical protein ASD06_03400 [Angustibacter sp. Root456]